MFSVKRTDSSDQDFITLVKLLDHELMLLDGDDHLFYAQLNKTNNIKQVIVAYDHTEPVGCGAIREYDTDTMEVKRMYVLPANRGKGVASMILADLENWSGELNYRKLILETGKRQPDAIALYQKQGYKSIPNYGKYENMENSVCFKKELKS